MGSLKTLRKQFMLEDVNEGRETQDGLQIPFILSTDAVDRDKDCINPNGWDLAHYRENPVVLWAHQVNEPPVAKSIEERVERGRLTSVAVFTPKDLNPFGHMVGQMYAKGFLRAVSVGFVARKWSLAQEKERSGGVDVHSQELLEYSCVPVPANPDALIEAKACGIDLVPLRIWTEKVLDQEREWNKKANAASVYEALKEPKVISIPLGVFERILQMNEKRKVCD